MTGTITILYDSFTYFGSGSGSASLVVDGVTIDDKEAQLRGWATSYERDGFSSQSFVHIPVGELRKVRKLHHKTAFWPGGKSEFKGTGKAYVRGQIRVRGGGDPLRGHYILDRAQDAFPAAFKAWEEGKKARKEARLYAAGRDNYQRTQWAKYGVHCAADYALERKLERMRFQRRNNVIF